MEMQVRIKGRWIKMSMHSGLMGRMRNENKEEYRFRHMDKRIVKFFLEYLKPYLRTLFLAVIAMGIVALVNIATPYLSKIAIDCYIIPGDKKGLHIIPIAFIAIYGVYWFASCWGSRFSIRLGQQIVADIRRDLFEHISSLSLDFFSKNKTGEILSRITNDVNALLEFVSGGIVNLISDILTLMGIVIIMLIINAKLAVVSLITIPIIFFGTLILGNHMRKAYGSAREKVGKLNAGVEENISGVKVVQAMSQESENAEAFEKLNRENLYAQVKAIAISAFFFPFMSLTNALGTALVLLAGGIMIAKGFSGITIGELIAFIGYTNQFFVPLSNMSQAYNLYQNAAASAERIYEYFEIKPAILSPENPKSLHHPIEGRIEFCNVNFQYEPNQTVIKNMNIALPPKQTTAVVGPSGAGKTTMVKLLARLYDVNEGAVKIDGIDVREMDIAELRKLIMVVPQDVYLFTGSIKENIRYGKPDATDEEVMKASEISCAHRFIQKLPDGYETQVGEGGMLLSGGQRQLIAFARAILADRPILILDEATSSMDAATETSIQQALEHLLEGRTSIIIAHRFTTIRKADKIVVLDEGKIVGYDSHDVLLKICERYKRLYEKQFI